MNEAPRKRWIALCGAAVVAIGAVIAIRSSHDGGGVGGAENLGLTPGASNETTHLNRIAWIDLPYSFEAGIETTSAVAGGVRIKDTDTSQHSSDGRQSYYVVLSPRDVAGLRCRAGALRTTLDPGLRLMIDVDNETAPFPAVLILSDSAGRRPVRLGEVGVPLGRSTLEFPLVYVERERRTLPLSKVATFALGCGVAELDRSLHVYFDNLRLGPGDTASRASSKSSSGSSSEKTTQERPETEREPGDLLPDGQFEWGLLTWRLRQFPKSRATIAIVEDDRAYREGRSLAIFELVKGGCSLVSADLSLAPGKYVVGLAVRGTEGMAYRVLTEQLRGDRWVRVLSKDRRQEAAPEEWSTGEWEVSIESSGLESSGNGSSVGSAVGRVVVEGIGGGDLFVDAIRLVSVERAGDAETRFELDKRPASGGAGQGPRLTWGGRGFLADRKPARPIFYCRDPASRSRMSKEFHDKCRARGLGAVLDVGGLFQCGLLDELEKFVRTRLDDPTIGLWLLSSDASWGVAPTVPSSVRTATQRLGEIDGRLITVGIGASRNPLAAYTFAESTDVLMVGGPVSPIPNVDSFTRFAEAVDGARRATGDGPLLASIDVRVPGAAVETFAYLAWLYGANGLVLNRFTDQTDVGAERKLEWPELAQVIERLRTISDLLASVTFDSGRIRVAGPVRYRVGRTDDGRVVLVAVNISNRALSDVEVEVAPSVSRKRSFEKWQGVVVVLDEG